MTRLAPSVTIVIVSCLAGVAAGLAVGAGQGKWLAAGLIALLFAAATWNRPELAVGALVLVMPLFGDRAIVAVPALPDVTVGRALIGWTIIVVGRAALDQRSQLAAVSRSRTYSDHERNTLAIWIFIFLALMGFAAVRNPIMQAGIQGWLDSYLLPFALLLVMTRYRWPTREIDTASITYLLACSLWSVLALIESILGSSLFSSDGTLGWASRGDALARTGGPFINPAFLGTALGIGIVLAWIYARRPARLRKIAIVTMPFIVIGLAVTQTRASWLGALAGIFAVLALTERRRLRLVATVALGLAAGIIALVMLLGATQFTDRATSTSEIFNRIIVQRAAVSLIGDHPVIGVGSGRFATLSRTDLRNVGDISGSFGISTLVPHNTVLSTAVDGGLGAAIALFVVFVLLVAAALRMLRAAPRDRFAVAAVGTLTVFVVNAMFIDIFIGASLAALSLTLIGIFLSPHPGTEQAP